MDAPPGKGDDPADFIRIATHLRALGLSAPRDHGQRPDQRLPAAGGSGKRSFARLIRSDSGRENTLYTAATNVLLHLQAHPAPQGLNDLSALDWADAACLALDWYRFAATGERVPTSAFRTALADVLSRHADGPRVMILRDYRAENLLWLPAQSRSCAGGAA